MSTRPRFHSHRRDTPCTTTCPVGQWRAEQEQAAEEYEPERAASPPPGQVGHPPIVVVGCHEADYGPALWRRDRLNSPNEA
jgi:hypothetical protein